MKPGREVIAVNLEEWQALLEGARPEPLDEESYEKLQAALRAFRLLTDLIGEKDTTISRLRAVLGKPSTEKTSKVLEQAGLEPSAKSHPTPGGKGSPGEKVKPGHGRKGAAAYPGAEPIKIPHASLKPGDPCPECRKGKVYVRKEPALRIRVVGQAPLAATVYELESRRCNLWGGSLPGWSPPGRGGGGRYFSPGGGRRGRILPGGWPSGPPGWRRIL